MSEINAAVADIRVARLRSKARARIEPRAESVCYDQAKDLLVLNLRGGIVLGVPVAAVRELRKAQPNQLKRVRAGFNGESISVDELDVDISVPGLLRDLIDVPSAAAVLGRRGGAVTSDAKAAAVRENGKRGGRPKKSVC